MSSATSSSPSSSPSSRSASSFSSSPASGAPGISSSSSTLHARRGVVPSRPLVIPPRGASLSPSTSETSLGRSLSPSGQSVVVKRPPQLEGGVERSNGEGVGRRGGGIRINTSISDGQGGVGRGAATASSANTALTRSSSLSRDQAIGGSSPHQNGQQRPQPSERKESLLRKELSGWKATLGLPSSPSTPSFSPYSHSNFPDHSPGSVHELCLSAELENNSPTQRQHPQRHLRLASESLPRSPASPIHQQDIDDEENGGITPTDTRGVGGGASRPPLASRQSGSSIHSVGSAASKHQRRKSLSLGFGFGSREARRPPSTSDESSLVEREEELSSPPRRGSLSSLTLSYNGSSAALSTASTPSFADASASPVKGAFSSPFSPPLHAARLPPVVLGRHQSGGGGGGAGGGGGGGGGRLNQLQQRGSPLPSSSPISPAPLSSSSSERTGFSQRLAKGTLGSVSNIAGFLRRGGGIGGESSNLSGRAFSPPPPDSNDRPHFSFHSIIHPSSHPSASSSPGSLSSSHSPSFSSASTAATNGRKPPLTSFLSSSSYATANTHITSASTTLPSQHSLQGSARPASSPPPPPPPLAATTWPPSQPLTLSPPPPPAPEQLSAQALLTHALRIVRLCHPDSPLSDAHNNDDGSIKFPRSRHLVKEALSGFELLASDSNKDDDAAGGRRQLDLWIRTGEGRPPEGVGGWASQRQTQAVALGGGGRKRRQEKWG